MFSGVKRKQLFADAGLLAVAIIWGFNFVVIKSVINELAPMVYLGIRFTLAFMILVCISPKVLFQNTKKNIIRALGVGLLLFGGFAAQTIGLSYTTPAISGFLTVAYIVFVPLIIGLYKKKYPGHHIVLGGSLILTGIGILSIKGTLLLGFGEALTLVCALLFALHIIALDCTTQKMSSFFLTTVQLGVVGILSLFFALFYDSFPAFISMKGWLGIVFGSLLGSIGGYFGQTIAQRYTSPSHVAIIMSTEAVFALLFSLLFGIEKMSARTFLGFAAVFIGVLIVEMFSIYSTQPIAGQLKDPIAAESCPDSSRD